MSSIRIFTTVIFVATNVTQVFYLYIQMCIKVMLNICSSFKAEIVILEKTIQWTYHKMSGQSS